MRRRLVVVRPEPGNARTVAAARAAGFEADGIPLFAVRPLAWTPPDPACFDALLLTSANAARHGGAGLATLAHLPALAVGPATAAAAEAAGLKVTLIGDADGAGLMEKAAARGYRRLLHLAGHDRSPLAAEVTVACYASDPIEPPPDWTHRLAGATLLLHSTRAARRVATLVSQRGEVMLAAISPVVLAAAGTGWLAGASASAPEEHALLDAAATLTD